ncbi:MAG: hypothetical protein EHM32_12430 [Spirochaetales bacterium]|nr:MAG: hypothetical protein EHM32_12430 [Spirochaetales bacterium]
MVGLAWALEIPPEILMLSFDSNYSASQAALHEFDAVIKKERKRFGSECLDLVFREWFLSELLLGKIQAPGFLDAWNDPAKYDIKQAWLMTEWAGAVKPTVDITKQVNGYKLMAGECWVTNDKAARELTGTKYTKNIRRLIKENTLKMEALRPILDAQKQYGEEKVKKAMEAQALLMEVKNVADATRGN